jgi:hypothetical protein
MGRLRRTEEDEWSLKAQSAPQSMMPDAWLVVDVSLVVIPADGLTSFADMNQRVGM